MGFVYDPEDQLQRLFSSPQSLSNIDQVLAHLKNYKKANNASIAAEISAYHQPHNIDTEIDDLLQSYDDMRQQAEQTQETIMLMTSTIQKWDTVKKNLVLSMQILHRMQMLLKAHASLMETANSHNYKEIGTSLGAVKELLDFFQPYKSLDDISVLHQQLHQTQNKLVDDIFIDFEDAFTNNIKNDELLYGCEILEMISPKYKDKLLTWFYNIQLKEFQSIFTAEAGSVENLSRRFIFFTNVLTNIRTNHMSLFPALWEVDRELSKLFTKLTSQDLVDKLPRVGSSSASIILDALTNSLNFEKQLNDTFQTEEFSGIILKLFEPYLKSWVQEQDSVLASSFMEFYASPKIPSELVGPSNPQELLLVLKVNSVPNLADSAVELFRTYQKLLVQAVKLSSGRVLLDLLGVFAKYLNEYANKIMYPVLEQVSINPRGIEPYKYLTMVLNTADYISNNISDLEDKAVKVIDENLKGSVDLEIPRSVYIDLSSRSLQALVDKVSANALLSWREFINYDWVNFDSSTNTPAYILGLIAALTESNRIALPMIMREAYVRSYCDRLLESLMKAFIKNLAIIAPLPTPALEQIRSDVSELRAFMTKLHFYTDPNFDDSNVPDDAMLKTPKAYLRYLNGQFDNTQKLLELLEVSKVPVEEFIRAYCDNIGDSSLKNFRMFLQLRGVEKADYVKYEEAFQLAGSGLTDTRSLILSFLEDQRAPAHTASQTAPPQINIREVVGSKSPEPQLPDFLKSNTAKIQNLRLNNPLKGINGEIHVNKINENFKNFGKFFRKDGD